MNATNAICVALSKVYPQVADAFHVPPAGSPHILHHATAFAWKVNPASAGPIDYAFGIADGRVVSAYRVRVRVADWPVMPAECPPETRGRRVIPLEEVSRAEWLVATSWSRVRMYGSVRYLRLETAADGSWERLVEPARELLPEERED